MPSFRGSISNLSESGRVSVQATCSFPVPITYQVALVTTSIRFNHSPLARQRVKSLKNHHVGITVLDGSNLFGRRMDGHAHYHAGVLGCDRTTTLRLDE